MTDAEKVAFAVVWWEAKQCPGCFNPLEDVAGKADGHRMDGELWYGGSASNLNLCSWTAEHLAALVHIGSGVVRYDRGTGVHGHEPAGRGDGSPRETAPTRCSSDLPLPGGSQHDT
jgi:hypothetical protein